MCRRMRRVWCVRGCCTVIGGWGLADSPGRHFYCAARRVSQRREVVQRVLTCCTSSFVNSLNSLDIVTVCRKQEAPVIYRTSDGLRFRVGSQYHNHMRSNKMIAFGKVRFYYLHFTSVFYHRKPWN